MQALKRFTRGRPATLAGSNETGRVEGTALMMEKTLRTGRTKLVLVVRIRFGDGKERNYPHTVLKG